MSRLSPLLRIKPVRTLLGQPGQSLNFRKAMDAGKILLCNLSDGILGVQASQLLGQFIVSKLQLAAMSRADIPPKARRPFYLYLDEFQAFTAVNEASYEEMLSRARKYKLGLILAHQQTGQLSRELMQAILGNVSSMITFSVSSDDARRLAREYVLEGEQTPHVPPEDFLRLQTGEAIAKIGRNVFPLKTYLAPQAPDDARAKDIIERSRHNYGLAVLPEKPATKPKPSKDEPPIDPAKVF